MHLREEREKGGSERGREARRQGERERKREGRRGRERPKRKEGGGTNKYVSTYVENLKELMKTSWNYWTI